MAGKKVKGGSRKVRDKWKAKEWYKIHAPRMFNEVEIGETPSADAAWLLGRTTEVTVHDLTGDFSKMHIKLKFKVDEVSGLDAKTVFTGMDLTSDYVRRLTRRKKTKTDHVVDVETKDGYVVRVKPMSIADKRIQSSQEAAMRVIMEESLKAMGAEQTISELVKSVISGDMAKEISRACRIIIPVKRIEIRKAEILSFGEGIPEPIEEPQPEAPEVDEGTEESEPEEAVEESPKEEEPEVVEEASEESSEEKEE